MKSSRHINLVPCPKFYFAFFMLNHQNNLVSLSICYCLAAITSQKFCTNGPRNLQNQSKQQPIDWSKTSLVQNLLPTKKQCCCPCCIFLILAIQNMPKMKPQKLPQKVLEEYTIIVQNSSCFPSIFSLIHLYK